ncbi:uncharacterized protein LOC111015182 [Momordica charantia]|uniref:Uncharacterized protein LOC111015182 n=1 Tax=Momordica charantia TaxID=3673 RepID=A0A6J1CXT6_MOMCH|nr:uncharacterized protein LOC111015182 [Momordica charantia]
MASLRDQRATRLVRTTSDHFPIQLANEAIKWGPTPFRFENASLDSPQLIPLVENWWKDNPLRGWFSYGFMEKLKGLKGILVQWNIDVLGNVGKKRQSFRKL